MNGVVIFHPIQPELEGKNIIDLKDVDGKALFQEMIETAKTQGSGWIGYMYQKPGESKPSKKSSYFKKVKVGEE
ncbi:cache domain-containing protein, partial [Desulfobacterota bacterium AH_259_B03_O07]|nr:cache domain-containing protein [Desulfobacterota bacterium AH_259_B03_O07]